MLTYNLDERGDESLYVHLYKCIRSDIESGAIGADSRLPSKRSLARHLGISVITVEGAYAQLLAEGYVYSRERSGYYACALPTARARSAAMPVRARSMLEDGQDRNLASADFADGSLGSPSETAALWGKALRSALAEEPEDELFSNLPAAGHPRLRRALAAHLAASRGMDVDPRAVVVGAGAQLFYVLIGQMLAPGTRIAVEDPGFSRITRAYAAARLRVSAVGLDRQGVRMDSLFASEADAIHITPSHQFPTGTVTSASRRYEVLGWAAADERRIIVEDDFDCEFRLSGRPIPSLASIDALGSVIYLNTFSKSLSSALRVAYLVLPPAMLERFEAEFGFYAGTVSALDQITLARLIESGAYERHVARIRTRHRAARDILVGELQASKVGHRLRFHGLDDGLHFVLEVEGADEQSLEVSAQRVGIGVAPLSRYCTDQGNMPPGTRLVMQYGAIPAEAIPEAAARLVRAIEQA